MNRLFLKGLPLAESALYLRRSVMLKNKHYRKAFTAVQKRNIATKQSGGLRNASQGIPETREIFSTSTVAHQATRRRVFSIRELSVDKKDAYSNMAQ
jgi:hypothetical protein